MASFSSSTALYFFTTFVLLSLSKGAHLPKEKGNQLSSIAWASTLNKNQYVRKLNSNQRNNLFRSLAMKIRDVGPRAIAEKSGRQDSNPSPSPRPKGYLFDPCMVQNECIGGRVCFNVFTERLCESELNECLCYNPVKKDEYEKFDIPPGVEYAFKYEQCFNCTLCSEYPNETCVKIPSGPSSNEGICVSVYPVALGFLEETDCRTFPHVTPDTEDITINTDFDDTYSYKSTPKVYPSPSVSKPLQVSNNVTSSNSTATPSASPLPSNSAGTCIEVSALTHFQRDELVYEHDQLANVLCDQHNSCATPGHMVTYHGKAMSMKSYCSIAKNGCIRKVSEVNSPKFSTRLRVNSNTKHLQFTSLAARFETKIEEHILRGIIHSGL